jgi:signal transduction histidine kinase
VRERVLHALDLGMLGDWDGAKRSLENLDDPIIPRLAALLTDQQRRERERAEMQAVARHELGNAISIAQANMEALVDGVLDPTPERLTGIRDAMITCGVLLEDLKKQYRAPRDNHVRVTEFDLRQLIASQVALVSSIAESKRVKVRFEPGNCEGEACTQFRGDPERVALIVRDVILGAVRFTPPAGIVEVDCAPAGGGVEVFVSTGSDANGETLGFSLVSKLVDAVGGQARILAASPRGTTLVLHLPTIN